MTQFNAIEPNFHLNLMYGAKLLIKMIGNAVVAFLVSFYFSRSFFFHGNQHVHNIRK